MERDERGGPALDPSRNGSGQDRAAALSPSRARPGPTRRLPWLRSLVVPLVVAFVVVALVRSMFVTTFSIAGDSMQDTLADGDRVLVVRPWLAGDYERGEIVVFDATKAYALPVPERSAPQQVLDAVGSLIGISPDTDHVKRIIGVAGDHVVCCDDSGRVSVNGSTLPEPYVFPGDLGSEVPFDITVPEGHLWVMGDHRSVSSDSRSRLGSPGGGMIPVQDVAGKVGVRYWPPARLGSP